MTNADARSPLPQLLPARADRTAPQVAGAPPTITSRQLFDGASEVRIDHDGTLYRLKRTALGKLILTK